MFLIVLFFWLSKGLYTVEKCWACTGLSGFRVYKYILKRVHDQPPPPWKEFEQNNNNMEDDKVNDEVEIVLFVLFSFFFLKCMRKMNCTFAVR